MESWPAPEVPTLAGRSPVPQVWNTPSGSLQRVGGGPVASMYVCGITPYDATHLGHAATYLAFDLLGRVWRDGGSEVRYVQNVTDVDDPLLERANRDGESWTALAERETQRYREDMTALRILPPMAYIGVVEAMDEVTALIAVLKEAGAVYDVDGDLYFAVGADPTFGEVAGLDVEQMLRTFAERGGDPERVGKKHPLDCLLWRAERPGEPSWPSPFGPGRPGWHSECTAIALNRLPIPLDVQGGGSDLAFPHHEMCASQAHVATGGQRFARAYVHAGMVGYQGEKMSKSRGNLVFVSQLRAEGVDPMALRLALLDGHYRSDREWTPEVLARGAARLDRWRAAVALPAAPVAAPVLTQVRQALAADLDSPQALAAVDDWADAALAGAGSDAAATAEVRDLTDALLGIAL